MINFLHLNFKIIKKNKVKQQNENISHLFLRTIFHRGDILGNHHESKNPFVYLSW